MIPVKNKDGTQTFINYTDIRGWGTEGYKITCKTDYGEYYWLKDIEDFQIIDKTIRPDRSSVGRIEKIKSYNKRWKKLIFDENESEAYLTVSTGRKKEVEKMVKLYNIPIEDA